MSSLRHNLIAASVLCIALGLLVAAPSLGAQAGTSVKDPMLTQRPLVAKGVAGNPGTIEVRLEDGGNTLVEIARSPDGKAQTTRRYRRLE